MAEPMKPSGEVDTSKRNLLRVGAGLGAVALSGPVLALTAATQKAVAAFKAAHPEWKDEFMPFEQDCIDGKISDKQCETAVKEQLADLEEEIKLQASKKQTNAREAQVNAREAQVNAREAQVNAREAQVKKESEMINRSTIVTVVLQLNNSIQHGNPDRSGIVALGRIKNPILQDDIVFLRSIDTRLTQKKVVTPQEVAKLQTILLTRAQESLQIYSSFTPEQQQEFISTKTIAIGAQKYALK